MTCQNCPNPVEYTLYANCKATPVCGAHIYAEKYGKHPDTYIIRPMTLKAHIDEYKEKRRV